MTTKDSRQVADFLSRLDTYHLDGGPTAFVKICQDIASSDLVGTYEEFTSLWERLVEEPKKMRQDENLSQHLIVRRAEEFPWVD